MNKYLFQWFSVILMLLCSSCEEKGERNTNKLTSINPLSYTSVIYSSQKDTVIVSTYSGRIAQRINGDTFEHIIANIDDEIYALAYAKTRKEIIAATLNTGIIVLDAGTGKIIKKLPLNNTWAIRIGLSTNENLLFTTDLKGVNHLWDASNDYREIKINADISKKTLRFADEIGNLYFSSKDSTYLWNMKTQQIEKLFLTKWNRLVDVDANGDLLLLNYNECFLFNKEVDSIAFKVSHPNWIYLNAKGAVLGEIPYSMQLTRAKFGYNKIYTAGIDRSIRIWDKITGTLIDSWTGHSATISDMQMSIDKKQMVSVDLKGNIKFWELN